MTPKLTKPRTRRITVFPTSTEEKKALRAASAEKLKFAAAVAAPVIVSDVEVFKGTSDTPANIAFTLRPEFRDALPSLVRALYRECAVDDITIKQGRKIRTLTNVSRYNASWFCRKTNSLATWVKVAN